MKDFKEWYEENKHLINPEPKLSYIPLTYDRRILLNGGRVEVPIDQVDYFLLSKTLKCSTY